jgi:hypothetical protein
MEEPLVSIRNGARASLLAVAGLMAIAAAPVAAKPMLVAGITEDVPCTFGAYYNWSSMGHGSDLVAHIGLVVVDANLNEAVIAWSTSSTVSGRFDTASASFTSTETTPYTYRVIAYLSTSKGSIIARSEVESGLASFTPETCG